MRESTTRGLFDGRTALGLLTGEPEYFEALVDEAPEGWIVTGYPCYDFQDGANKTIVNEYIARFNETSKIGSLVGDLTAQSITAVLEKAGSTEQTQTLRRTLHGAG